MNENMFSFTFYATFHAFVTLLFSSDFHEIQHNVELRYWE